MLKENSCSVVVGGAGFIGSNLIEILLNHGHSVIAVDNLSRGSVDNFERFKNNSIFKFIHADISNNKDCLKVFEEINKYSKISEIWHLAANSDIPAGINNPYIDLKDTFLTTFELLNAAKFFDIKNFHFASSSAIYGDLGNQVLHENIGPLLPISNYGAMKLASEAQISAATESFLERANIFRFPNVVGVPATHGVILDFFNKLISDQSMLTVLGDGTQQKSYLHVSDLVNAMILVRDKSFKEKVQVVNIGPLDEGISVKEIAEKVVLRVNPSASIKYGNERRGWVGDVPKFIYSIDKLQSYKWRPKLNSSQAIDRAIEEIALQLNI